MKKLFLLSLALLSSIASFAYRFEVEGIWYNVLSEEDLTCEVTDGKKYSGDITIPSTVAYNEKTFSVTSIGDRAFSHCESLTSVTIPNSVTSIGLGVFYTCSGLTSVTIPNSVTSIGDYAFSGCSSLTSVIIPNSVTSLGEGAFYGCHSLPSITIPSSVTSIGEEAFMYCSSLTSVISKMKNPCGIYADCFPDKVFQNAKLFVPKGTINVYKSKKYWNLFNSIEEGKWQDADGIEGLKISDDSEIAVYDLKGAAVYKGKRAGMPEHLKGLYIVKLGGKAVKCRL